MLCPRSIIVALAHDDADLLSVGASYFYGEVVGFAGENIYHRLNIGVKLSAVEMISDGFHFIVRARAHELNVFLVKFLAGFGVGDFLHGDSGRGYEVSGIFVGFAVGGSAVTGAEVGGVVGGL